MWSVEWPTSSLVQIATQILSNPTIPLSNSPCSLIVADHPLFILRPGCLRWAYCSPSVICCWMNLKASDASWNSLLLPLHVNPSVAGKVSLIFTFSSWSICLAVEIAFLLLASSLVMSGKREMLHPLHTVLPFSRAALRTLSLAEERRNFILYQSRQLIVFGQDPGERCGLSILNSLPTSMPSPSERIFAMHSFKLVPSLPSVRPSNRTLLHRLLFSKSSTRVHSVSIHLLCSLRSVTSCCVVSSMSDIRPSALVNRTCIVSTLFFNSAVVCLIFKTSEATVSSVALIWLAFCSGCLGLASLESAADFPRTGLKYLEVAISVLQMMRNNNGVFVWLLALNHVTSPISIYFWCRTSIHAQKQQKICTIFKSKHVCYVLC